MKRNLVHIILLATGALLLSSCSLEANISSIVSETPTVIPQRMSGSDFTHGQIVTTGSGTVVIGTFGEISQKRTLSNGVVIEGTIHE